MYPKLSDLIKSIEHFIKENGDLEMIKMDGVIIPKYAYHVVPTLNLVQVKDNGKSELSKYCHIWLERLYSVREEEVPIKEDSN